MDIFTNLGVGSESGVINFIQSNPIIFVLILAWTLVWKGLALWKSARLSHKWWFVVLMIANTVGILEIIYIYFVARKYTVEQKIEQ